MIKLRIVLVIFISVILVYNCEPDTSKTKHYIVLESKFINDFLNESQNVNNNIDSLNNRIKKATSDTVAIILLNVLITEMHALKPELSGQVADSVLAYSDKHSFKYGRLEALNNIGLTHTIEDNYDSAMVYFKQVKDGFDLYSKLPLAKAYYGVGNVFRLTEKPNESLNNYKEALMIINGYLYGLDSLTNNHEWVVSHRLLGMIYREIGYVYISQRNFDKAIDSFNKWLAVIERINAKDMISSAYYDIAEVYNEVEDFEKALELYKKSIEIAMPVRNIKIASAALNNKGIIIEKQGDLLQALEIYERSLKLRQEMDDKKAISATLNNLGNIALKQGNPVKAIDYHHQSLQIKEKLNDAIGIAISLNNIGRVYFEQRDYDKALEYYYQCLEIRKETEDKHNLAGVYNNIGIVYRHINNYEKALEYYERSLAIREELGQKRGVATMLNNIGILYRSIGEIDNALVYYERSLKISEELGLRRHITSTCINIGNLFLEKGDLTNTLEYAQKSYDIAVEVGNPLHIRMAAKLLNDTYRKLGNYKKAIENYDIYIHLRDSMINLQNKDALEKRYWQYEYEKKAIADSLQHAQDIQLKVLELAKKQEESKRQIITIYAMLGLFSMMIFLVIIAYRSYRIKVKSNRIISEKNDKLEQAYKEIKIQHNSLEKLNVELQSINKEILIQKAEIIKQKEEAEKQKTLVEEKNIHILEQKEEIMQQKEGLQMQSNELTRINTTLEDKIAEELDKSRKKDFLLIQQSRQAAMGEMIANIAHQWRQPLNAIGLIVQNLQEACEYDELTKEYLDKTVNHSMDIIQYMSQTINDFRDFFKPEKAATDFDVRNAVLKSISFIENTIKNNNIQLKHSLSDNVSAFGFSNEYSQVVLNLINNAMDALLESKVKNPKIEISLALENNKSCLTVTDNGGGIKPVVGEKIFKPYFSTKKEAEGTGLGLYMSKTIIEKHEGGSLTFENTDDGVKFIVVLPKK